jgi:hypothetical protein
MLRYAARLLYSQLGEIDANMNKYIDKPLGR